MKVNFKKGDTVKVISGRYKGQEAVVSKSFLSKGFAYVEGVNIKKKSIKKKEAESSDNFQYITHPIYFSKLKKIDALQRTEKPKGETEIAESKDEKSKKASK